MLQPIITNITDIKPLRQVEVNLDRRALPIVPQSILDFDIDLGTVENALPSIYAVGQFNPVQDILQRFRGFFPHLNCAGIFCRACRQQQFVFTEAKG